MTRIHEEAQPGPPTPDPAAPYTADTVPGKLFVHAYPLQQNSQFVWGDPQIQYKVWKHSYNHEHLLVPVPIKYEFLAPTLDKAADVMAKALLAWQEQTPHATFVPAMVKKAILYALHQDVQPGDTFASDHLMWTVSTNAVFGQNSKQVHPVSIEAAADLYQLSVTAVKNIVKAGNDHWGSVLNPAPAWAATPAAPETMGWLAENILFKMFDAAAADTGPKHGKFVFMGQEVYKGYQYDGDTYPVWNNPESYQPHYTDSYKGAKAIYKVWQKWKAQKKVAPPFPGGAKVTGASSTVTFQMTGGSGITANIPYTTGINGSVGVTTKKSSTLPKWGPATWKFEQALAEALKKRLGPYATDSMVKAVKADMLPVLKDYWDEVNAALVALKMTAAEQGKDIPTSIPGWKIAKALDDDLLEPTIAPTKIEGATTALWKAGLSPYLKKQYTQRIEFGIHCGALEADTTLETPYIELWIMAVKKHTKKGEPPMSEDYQAATADWKKSLEGLAA